MLACLLPHRLLPLPWATLQQPLRASAWKGPGFHCCDPQPDGGSAVASQAVSHVQAASQPSVRRGSAKFTRERLFGSGNEFFLSGGATEVRQQRDTCAC